MPLVPLMALMRTTPGFWIRGIPARSPPIQNGGVRRMSAMRDMLRIALDRDAHRHHEPNERGNCRSGSYHPEMRLPFIPSIARGVFGGLDGFPGSPSCRSCVRPLGSGCQVGEEVSPV